MTQQFAIGTALEQARADGFRAGVRAERIVAEMGIPHRDPIHPAETPAEILRRLALAPDVPRKDLWDATATAVLDVIDRLAVLEAADAENRRYWTATREHLRRSQQADAGPVQPG